MSQRKNNSSQATDEAGHVLAAVTVAFLICSFHIWSVVCGGCNRYDTRELLAVYRSRLAAAWTKSCFQPLIASSSPVKAQKLAMGWLRSRSQPSTTSSSSFAGIPVCFHITYIFANSLVFSKHTLEKCDSKGRCKFIRCWVSFWLKTYKLAAEARPGPIATFFRSRPHHIDIFSSHTYPYNKKTLFSCTLQNLYP